MALSNNPNKFKVEYAVIGILVAALVAMAIYMMVVMKPSQSTQALESQPVAQVPQQATEAQPQLTETPTPLGFGMAVGKYQGEVHPIIDILDDLKGYKYDESVAPSDTVYIVFDPRCPYCHSLYEKVSKLDLKSKEITVKWLPSLALGVDDHAEKLAAMSIHAKSIDEFAESFNKDADTSNITVTQADKDALTENMAFLFEASNQTFGEGYAKSVPAVFFIDKNTGSPNMMYGASEDAIFKQIFGD